MSNYTMLQKYCVVYEIITTNATFIVKNIKNERPGDVPVPGNFREFRTQGSIFDPACDKWSNSVLGLGLLNRNKNEGENGEIKR